MLLVLLLVLLLLLSLVCCCCCCSCPGTEYYGTLPKAIVLVLDSEVHETAKVETILPFGHYRRE